jgi:hypothetical protein
MVHISNWALIAFIRNIIHAPAKNKFSDKIKKAIPLNGIAFAEQDDSTILKNIPQQRTQILQRLPRACFNRTEGNLAVLNNFRL